MIGFLAKGMIYYIGQRKERPKNRKKKPSTYYFSQAEMQIEEKQIAEYERLDNIYENLEIHINLLKGKKYKEKKKLWLTAH